MRTPDPAAATTDEFVWIPEEVHDPPQRYDWQTDLQSDRRCRMKGCSRRAVAKLMRSNGWWHYCARHLYGRRIVGTTIEHRVMVGSPAHERFLARSASCVKKGCSRRATPGYLLCTECAEAGGNV